MSGCGTPAWKGGEDVSITRIVTGSVVAALSAALVVLYLVVPATTDLRVGTMVSSSMAPDLPRGSLLISAPLTYRDIQAGDIIQFQYTPDSTPRAHRAIEKAGDSWVTAGDALDTPDIIPLRPDAHSVRQVIYGSYTWGWALLLAPWVLGILLILFASTFLPWRREVSLGLALAGMLLVWPLGLVLNGTTTGAEIINLNQSRQNPSMTLVNTGLNPVFVTADADGEEVASVFITPRDMATIAAPEGTENVDYAVRPNIGWAYMALISFPFLVWLGAWLSGASIREESQQGQEASGYAAEQEPQSTSLDSLCQSSAVR